MLNFTMEKIMKKFFLLAVLILFPAASFANFDIGAKIGYTATKFSTDASQISSDFSGGFQIGAFARFGGTFFLQPELMYSVDGGKLGINVNNQTPTYDINQKAIDLGVLLGLKIIDGGIIGVNLQAGAFASILTDKGITDALDDAHKADFESLNYGIKFGAGAELGNFTLDLRYIMGLNDVYKSGEGFTNFDMKKSKVEVTLGIKFLSF